MPHIELNQAKHQLETMLQAALNGEDVVITQNSEPVLKLVRVTPSVKRRTSGSACGMIINVG